MEYTNNLNLRLPQGSCYWNLDTWKTNMNILDKAYLDIQHNIHASLIASNITCSNAKSDGKLVSTNCQSMFEEMNHKLSRVRFITVTSDMTIPIATDAHDYLVLTFGDPVYNVTFAKSNPSSSNNFSYLNGYPIFQKNKSYEMSFLRLCCLWKEKNEMDWTKYFVYTIADNTFYITDIKDDVWYTDFNNYDFYIPDEIDGMPVVIKLR